MIKYIIQLRDGSCSFYAGDNIKPTNVWTSNPNMATRFRERQAAITMRDGVAEHTRLVGTFSIREIDVKYDY